MAEKKDSTKLIAQNKKARHEYFILETYECGIELFGTADLAADPTVWTAQSISADGTVGTQQAAVSALTDSLTVGDLSITAAETNRKISITNNSENYVLFTHMWPYSHFTKW